MNIENKIVIIQILDCWMRLTSIQWQARTWNKYKSFTDNAECRGYQNIGHMINENRLGEFEERCAGGVYLADVWMAWLDVRNQLACFLHTVSNLMEMCRFLWAGSTLVGIHVTVPFMSMLLDHKVTPRQLLTVLPRLYNDLAVIQSEWPILVIVSYFNHIFYIHWKWSACMSEAAGIRWRMWSALDG